MATNELKYQGIQFLKEFGNMVKVNLVPLTTHLARALDVQQTLPVSLWRKANTIKMNVPPLS